MANPQYIKGAIDATGCISNAWEMIKPNYWLFFGVAVVAAIILGAVSFVPFIGPIVSAILAPPIMGGVYYLILRAMRNDPVDFGMMFKGFEKAGPLFLIGLITAIPALITQVVELVFRTSEILIRAIVGNRGFQPDQFQSGTPDIAIAGGILIVVLICVFVYLIFSIAWGITFAFVVPIAMDQDVDVMTAIKLSAKSGWSNLGGVIVLSILSWLMLLGGAIVCCIGLFFVLPIVEVAWAFAYRQVFPDLAPQTYRYEPPSPDAYQGSFGQGL